MTWLKKTWLKVEAAIVLVSPRLKKPASRWCLRQDPIAQVGQELAEAGSNLEHLLLGLGPSALSWPCFNLAFWGRVTPGCPDCLRPGTVALLPLTLVSPRLPFLRLGHRHVPAGPASRCFWFSVGFFSLPHLWMRSYFKINLVTCPNNSSLYRSSYMGDSKRTDFQETKLWIIYVQNVNGIFL